MKIDSVNFMGMTPKSFPKHSQYNKYAKYQACTVEEMQKLIEHFENILKKNPKHEHAPILLKEYREILDDLLRKGK